MGTSHLLEDFAWRGLVYDVTDGVTDLLARERVSLYAGFDPTASSLHVGHLLPAMALARFQRAGHAPIALIGGATGLIGDPSGKSQERVLLTPEQIEENVGGVRRQLAGLLDTEHSGQAVRIVNNADWLGRLDLLSFLRDTGKCFTVNYLLQKESVVRRLDSAEGISFTEFSYLLLQAHDFLQVFDRYGCTLQVGGSDQWGNITAGIDLIRRVRAKKAHGLVMPLLAMASGMKFGKTEAGTIWLDAARTSPFRFYQFWLNIGDGDVVKYLKFFTLLDPSTVDQLEEATVTSPEQRTAQRVLASEVTALVHGVDQAARAEHASGLLFGEDIRMLPPEDVLAVFDDVPSTELPIGEIDGGGMALIELVARVRLASSKSEARRLVQSGGVYVNNRRASDPQARVYREDAIGGTLFVLRRGQRQNHLVRLV